MLPPLVHLFEGLLSSAASLYMRYWPVSCSCCMLLEAKLLLKLNGVSIYIMIGWIVDFNQTTRVYDVSVPRICSAFQE